MYEQYAGTKGNDVGAEGLKGAVIGWANAYYVGYALMMTIAFGLLVVEPTPRSSKSFADCTAAELVHWRPQSPLADAMIQLLYVFFVLAAAYDSTWGTLLCAEWGVRAPVVPARVYEHFLSRVTMLESGKSGRDARYGFLVRTLTCGRWHGCVGEFNGWDPYYMIDRTVLSLFASAALFLYLSRGVLFAAMALGFLFALRARVFEVTLALGKASLGAMDENVDIVYDGLEEGLRDERDDASSFEPRPKEGEGGSARLPSAVGHESSSVSSGGMVQFFQQRAAGAK